MALTVAMRMALYTCDYYYYYYYYYSGSSSSCGLFLLYPRLLLLLLLVDVAVGIVHFVSICLSNGVIYTEDVEDRNKTFVFLLKQRETESCMCVYACSLCSNSVSATGILSTRATTTLTYGSSRHTSPLTSSSEHSASLSRCFPSFSCRSPPCMPLNPKDTAQQSSTLSFAFKYADLSLSVTELNMDQVGSVLVIVLLW